MRAGFFPLDRELDLPPVRLTPHAYETLVRLGTWMPFGRAGKELEQSLGIVVSEATVRRYCEGAGAAQMELQTGEMERIERELPEAPPGAEKMLLSVDGAMVPIVGGEWVEVKTMALGVIEEVEQEAEGQEVHSTQLTYFSRLAEAAVFARQALVETQRRGLENAGLVAAVTDGAEWEQGFIDYHRPDARRILDFAHAAERISGTAQDIWGPGTPRTEVWSEQHCRSLKKDGPDPLLADLYQLQQSHPHSEVLATDLRYLEKRRDHMQYPDFLAEGLPVGSGAVESANKLVVEARLKGSGMHWAPAHVNPMLALRNVACNDRWEETWPQLNGHQRQQALRRQRRRRQQRRTVTDPLSTPPPGPIPSLVPSPSQGLQPAQSPPDAPSAQLPARKPNTPWKPPSNHPWRRMPVGKARFQPPTSGPAKN